MFASHLSSMFVNNTCVRLCQVEYDVINSGIDDVRLISSDRIEQSAVPTCLAWYPPVVKESFLAVADDQVRS